MNTAGNTSVAFYTTVIDLQKKIEHDTRNKLKDW